MVVPSSDVTAVVVRLAERAVLVLSVYVPGNDAEALEKTVGLLGRLINDVRHEGGTRTDMVLAGDFNRHDQVWGGDDVATT